MNNGSYLSIEETQQAELQVMKALHAFCEKHGLHYVLAYGTLLGAVRHKGFIPWDNDMDIFMPVRDLEKLLALSKQEEIDPDVYLMSHESDPDFHYIIVRACNAKTVTSPSYLYKPIENMGVWVDIFPLYGLNRFLYYIQKPLGWFYLEILKAIIYKYAPEQKLKSFLQKFILKCLPDKNHRYEKRLIKMMLWQTSDRAKQYLTLEDSLDRRQALPRQAVEQAVLMDYEDTRFYVPQNWDQFLTAMYGDYMQIPPVKDRQTHEAMARWKKDVSA